MWRPSTMMTTPPTMPRARLWACSSSPTTVAAAPRATKTVEKPSTKNRLVRATRRVTPGGASAPRSWARFTPLMNDR
jgi:hypothetical protein